jgi:hypothetical protein
MADDKLKKNDIVCFQICRIKPCLTVRNKQSIGGCVVDVVERYNLQSTVKTRAALAHGSTYRIDFEIVSPKTCCETPANRRTCCVENMRSLQYIRHKTVRTFRWALLPVSQNVKNVLIAGMQAAETHPLTFGYATICYEFLNSMPNNETLAKS